MERRVEGVIRRKPKTVAALLAVAVVAAALAVVIFTESRGDCAHLDNRAI